MAPFLSNRFTLTPFCLGQYLKSLIRHELNNGSDRLGSTLTQTCFARLSLDNPGKPQPAEFQTAQVDGCGSSQSEGWLRTIYL